ncbi:MAG TPA: DEAD/DEAH box helicase [Luteimonas sp.]|nr:DEAD/DEAH box helicase [Luteimonas sp.]
MKSDAPRTRFDAPLADWFAAQGWKAAPFQREAWRRWRRGESGLLVTPTGSGKTLAALGGPLLDALAEAARASSAKPSFARASRASASTSRPTKTSKTLQPASSPTAIPSAAGNRLPSAARTSRSARNDRSARTRLLWITPLRALASDTTRAIRTPLEALGLDWTVAMRTGDASSRDKRLARQGRADVLVITPESLALLLTYPDTAAQLAGLRGIVVDEWHELLGNKRGVLLQLCLARLRDWAPQVRTWGLSATLGNLAQARDVLLPHAPNAAILQAAKPRSLSLDTLLPEAGERFPWAGHIGLS